MSKRLCKTHDGVVELMMLQMSLSCEAEGRRSVRRGLM